jgi:folate-binding protein YgfZ
MSLSEEVQAIHENAGVVDRSDRGAVLVSGPDAWSYLQSIVSADLDAVGDGEGVHSLLLTPQGKLDVDFRLLRVGDEAWLDCDPGFGEQLAASLNRFRIRVECEVTDRSGSWGSLAVRGPEAAPSVAELGVELPAASHAHVQWEDAVVVCVPWPEGDGFDVVGPQPTVGEAADRLTAAGVQAVSAGAYETVRIELGIPRQGFELDEKTIPQEAFLERDAVSFTKGCFLGQELVCRIDTRGRVNRYLRRLTGIEEGRPPRGSEIVSGDKVVGAVTSTVGATDLPAAALGYVRHEVEPPAEVELRWNGGHGRARVEPVPTLARAPTPPRPPCSRSATRSRSS